MGQCLCKEKKRTSNSSKCVNCLHLSTCCRWGKQDEINDDYRGNREGNDGDIFSTRDIRSGGSSFESITSSPYVVGAIDNYVLDTLKILRTLVDNEAEPPPSMVKLHAIAELEDGWLIVVQSIVRCIPERDPLGPAVISLLLDDCPLPTKENSAKLSDHLDLNHQEKYDARERRNICILLGCLAEKLAGQNSTSLLNKDVLKFLINNLSNLHEPSVVLYSIIALEKFAQTSENKTVIREAIVQCPSNPFVTLEHLSESTQYDQRQVGFCAQWTLDNIFTVKERPYGYETVDNQNVNVILNSYDVSEYLKIAPSGLEARCDASSFESVRSTFQVDSGAWYYEVLIITEGVMQIGWATKASKFLNHEGFGIGDDEFSVAYDGCRQVMWHDTQSEPMSTPCWKSGDILGTLLDLDNFKVIFFLNGKLIKTHEDVFKHTKSGFFAAGSFMAFQQCRFNFGSEPFQYAPQGFTFKNFNEYAKLGDECRVVLPRHLRMEYLRKVSVKENACNLCFDHIANVRLLPCEHCGFCSTCADQLDNCPMCRQQIENKITMFEADFDVSEEPD